MENEEIRSLKSENPILIVGSATAVGFLSAQEHRLEKLLLHEATVTQEKARTLSESLAEQEPVRFSIIPQEQFGWLERERSKPDYPKILAKHRKARKKARKAAKKARKAMYQSRK